MKKASVWYAYVYAVHPKTTCIRKSSAIIFTPIQVLTRRVLHVHKVPLDENEFVHIPQVSLGYAHGRILQGRISHHKYHTYMICPLLVYNEAGGYKLTIQRLCYK